MTNFISIKQKSIVSEILLLIEDLLFNYLPENNLDNILM